MTINNPDPPDPEGAEALRAGLIDLAVTAQSPSMSCAARWFSVVVPSPGDCLPQIGVVLHATGAGAVVAARVVATDGEHGRQSADTDRWHLTWSHRPGTGLTLRGERH